MLKVSENPPLVWPQTESLRQFSGLWWVAHTKSRNEKALAHDLMAKNISYFLPMTWMVHRHSHRTLKSLLPLFTGYLFFCGNENERVELLKTNRVANLIEVKNQDSLIHELVRFEQALRTAHRLRPINTCTRGNGAASSRVPCSGWRGSSCRPRAIPVWCSRSTCWAKPRASRSTST